MTSDEISQNIQSQTGLRSDQFLWRNHLHLEGANDPVDKETKNEVNPLFSAYIKDEQGKWAGLDCGNAIHILGQESDREIIIVFNPFALPPGLLRWLINKPEGETTHNLMFSYYNWNIPNLTTLKELCERINSTPLEYMSKAYNSRTGIGRPNSIRQTTMDRLVNGSNPYLNRETLTDFEVNISYVESGSCHYRVNVNHYCASLTEAQMEDIRTIYNEEGNEAALNAIKEEIIEQCNNGDGDYNDFEYDDHDFCDSELDFDDTDYHEILERILDQ